MPTKRSRIAPAEARRALDEHFVSWLAGLRRGAVEPVLAGPGDPHVAAIIALQSSRKLRYERLGDWQLGGNYDVPLPESDEPPTHCIDCIGHAPNGDLFCAVRKRRGAGPHEVWLFNHELGRLTEVVAESVAAFAYLAALDGRLEKGLPYFEPDEAFTAAIQDLDDAAFDARMDAGRAAFDAESQATLARDLAVLDGRVAPPWMFLGIKPFLPGRFVRYASKLPAP